MTELMGQKRDWRAVSYALCSAVTGVIIMRLVLYFAPFPSDTYGDELASGALFTLVTQLVFFLAIPFCIYRFYGRRTVRQVLQYSSVGGFKPYFLILIPVGFCLWVATLGVSSLWLRILQLIGYNMPSGGAPMPESFSFGYFVVDVLLTALLPAVCEEFIMRGGLLTTARKTFKTVGCVVLCGIVFGLFHQNAKQLFYTALFGALAAFLTLRFKSIFPAMILHFVNNFCSVFFNYASEYDWAVGGSFFDIIEMFGQDRPWALALVFICAIAVGGGLIFLMMYLRERRIIENKVKVIKDSGFDVTNKRVVLLGKFDAERVSDLEMEKEVYGAGYVEEMYRPDARDIMTPIALGTVTLLTTVFSFVWGLFY